jgi:myo-inositol 2-dehydrogenase/D-chiro-inositol 1-dehydrogenase
MSERTVGVGIIGSRFVAELHAAAFKRVKGAKLVACASPDRSHVEEFARRFEIPRSFTDYQEMLKLKEVELVSLALPNDLHAEACIACARAGKHVIIEKPLCLSLSEADRMIASGNEAGVHLFYAEEICFSPKYVRAKQLVDSGALGQVYLVKQAEKHSGPHAGWFWDVERSGGGVAMDMGCHGIEFFRWMLGKPRARSVYAHLKTNVHRAKTLGDDEALIIVEFENGATGLAEESWTKLGGMDDRAEIYGSRGMTCADLLKGNSLLTYSEVGYDYAVEKAGSTVGWTFTMYEEMWNYGFPQEMQHFVDCLLHGAEPIETAQDGRAVLEILFAAYQSAGTGRRVDLPFSTDARKPFDLWKGR